MKSKVFFLSALCTLVSFTYLNAQIATGFSIGVVQSHLKSDLFEQDHAGLGYRVGFDMAVAMGDRFEIQPSIAYATKGASAQASYYRPEVGLQLSSYDYDYQSFQGQMLLAVKPMNNVRFQAGGYLDAMSSRLPNEENNIFLGDLSKEYIGRPASDLSEAFSGIDYGPVVGVSMGNNIFRVTAQYMHGLANLYEYTQPNASGHSINTRTFSVAATYYFVR